MNIIQSLWWLILIRYNRLVMLLFVLSYFTVALTGFNVSVANAAGGGGSSDTVVGYVTQPIIAPGETIEVMVGIIDSGGIFITGSSIDVEHVASSTNVSTTSSSQLQSVNITIPGGTSEGLHELFIQSGTLNTTINFQVSNSGQEGSFDATMTVSSFPEVNVGTLFNGSVFFKNDIPGIEVFYGDELLITTLQWDSTIIVLNSEYLATGFYSGGVTLDFQAYIPLWLQATENYTIDITLLNSSLYLDISAQQSFNIPEQEWVYNISFPNNDTTLNRLGFSESSSENFAVSLTSVSLIDLEVEADISTTSTGPFTLLSRAPVTQSTFDVPFYAPFGISLGNATIELRFYRQTQLVQTIQENISVYDLIDASITLFPNILEPGETVQIEIVTSEQDTLIPVATNFTITDSLINGTLLSGSTPATGQIITNLDIPANITTGSRFWYIDLVPANTSQDYQGQTITITQNIIGNTVIQLINPPLQVARGQNVTLQALVSSEGQPVTEGTLYLKDSDGNTLQSFAVNTTADYQFQIDLDQPIGQNDFTWEYSGSTSYEPASTPYSLIVLSHPHFDLVQVNSTNVAPGNWIQITGQLLEENDTLVSSTSIEIWKILSTGQTSLLDSITVTNGDFSYEFEITENLEVGIHTYELRFLGDPSRYYLSGLDTPRIEFTRNLGLSLTLDTDELGFLYGNVITTAHLDGRIFADHIIEYDIDGSNNWITLGQVTLNNEGQGSTEITLPNYYGPITIQARDTITNDTNTIVTSLYIQPDYSISITDSAQTGSPVSITTFSDTEYRVYVDGLAISPPDPLLIGEWEYNHTFTDSGTHKIRLTFENDYVSIPFIEEEVYIVQGLILEINAPDVLNEGTLTTLDLKLLTDSKVPLQDIKITLERLYYQYASQNSGSSLSEILGSTITGLDGSATLFSEIRGSESVLYFKVHANSDLDIVNTTFAFPSQVLRQLEIDLPMDNLVGFDNKLVSLQFEFSYTHVSEEIASLIPYIIQVTKGGIPIEGLESLSINSDNQGKVNIQLSEVLEPGTYLITISVDAPGFIQLTEPRTLIIEHADPVPSIQTSNTALTIGATLGFLGALVLTLRRYTRS